MYFTHSCLQFINCLYLTAAPTVFKDVLVALVNFLAYFEAEEVTKDAVETEIQGLKNRTQQMEKELEDRQRDLNKSHQVSIPIFLQH